MDKDKLYTFAGWLADPLLPPEFAAVPDVPEVLGETGAAGVDGLEEADEPQAARHVVK